MWTRALIKENAKLALKNFYWFGLLAYLIVSAISYVASQIVSQAYIFLLYGGIGASGLYYNESSTAAAISMLTLIPITLLVFFAAFFALEIFGLFPLSIGFQRYYLESRSFKSKLERIFCVFACGKENYFAVAKTMAVYFVKIFLWSLLFIIPGIVKAYEYRMVPYILAENPTIPTKRVFELSRQMTTGEKGAMFVLDLSFTGWFILGVLAFFVGTMFVYPYYFATYAELYTALREKAFGLLYTDSSELIGIHP